MRLACRKMTSAADSVCRSRRGSRGVELSDEGYDHIGADSSRAAPTSISVLSIAICCRPSMAGFHDSGSSRLTTVRSTSADERPFTPPGLSVGTLVSGGLAGRWPRFLPLALSAVHFFRLSADGAMNGLYVKPSFFATGVFA